MADTNKEDKVNEAAVTPAAASLKTHAIADTIKRMQGMSHDDITKLWAQFATVDKNTKSDTKDNSAANKASISMKPSDASALKEDIALIFGEDNKDLSEEFLEKTTTLFEAALSLKTAELRESVFEEAAELVNEEVENAIEEITENLDDYLNHAVAAWLEENKLAVEQGLRFNQMQSFFEGMKELFTEHNIDIPADAVDIVEALTAEIEELKEVLNEQVDKNIENQKVIDEALKEQAFDEISEGLAKTEVEKLRTLSEGVEGDLETYRKKVSTIKEAHFKSDKKDSSILKEEILDPEAKPEAPKAVGVMSHYADAIHKQVTV